MALFVMLGTTLALGTAVNLITARATDWSLDRRLSLTGALILVVYFVYTFVADPGAPQTQQLADEKRVPAAAPAPASTVGVQSNTSGQNIGIQNNHYYAAPPSANPTEGAKKAKGGEQPPTKGSRMNKKNSGGININGNVSGSIITSGQIGDNIVNNGPPVRQINPGNMALAAKLLSEHAQKSVTISLPTEANREITGLGEQLVSLFKQAGWTTAVEVWYGHGCDDPKSDIAVPTKQPFHPFHAEIAKSLTQTGLSVNLCQGAIDDDGVKVVVLPPRQ